jgi:putative spermidine/putrescine transport system substrate-binding protein
MTELFQSGQVVMGVWGSGRVKAFQDTGFPVAFVYPKEGAIALGISACPVAKPNASPLAQEFLSFMLSAEVQAMLAKAPVRPVNKNRVTGRSAEGAASTATPSLS